MRQLKEDAYRFKGIIDEKGLARKDVIDETEKLKSKIERAKEINLLLQKNAQRAKKAKSKLCEEVRTHNKYIFICQRLTDMSLCVDRL